MRPLNRIPVNGPVDAYKTYSVRLPEATHYRDATCEEAECEAWQRGWKTVCDITTDIGQKQAHYITTRSGRAWTCEESSTDAPLRTFMFAPGQQCFSSHRLMLEREPLFLIRDGDYRGNPTGRRTVVRAQDWIDDFGEHQQRLADQQERG